jgi:hypothetical protein
MPIAWQAQIVEQDLPEKRSGGLVGNLGVGENTNRRALEIQVFNAASLIRRHVYEIPSHTVPGDPCSTRDVEILEKDGLLELEAEYSYACGAGSSTSARYKIDVKPDASRLTHLELTHSSREQTTSIQVDYKLGRLSVSEDRPEDGETEQKPVVRRIPKQALALDASSLLNCPKPLRGNQIQSCRAR